MLGQHGDNLGQELSSDTSVATSQVVHLDDLHLQAMVDTADCEAQQSSASGDSGKHCACGLHVYPSPCM